MHKTGLALILLLGAGSALAETPAELVTKFAAQAARDDPGFAPSAQRGQSFFLREWGVSKKMPNCTVCHSKNLKAEGKHVITDKPIEPLSPQVNPERFTNLKKVEKWFRRNCSEVTGHECTAAEKADFIQFVIKGT
jgi:Domain of unknown function (DUF1924)